jgi:hypothetical protein
MAARIAASLEREIKQAERACACGDMPVNKNAVNKD